MIFVLDTYHTVVAAFMGWNFLCSGWGRPSALVYPGWTFVSIPIISGIGKLGTDPLTWHS